MTGAGFDVDLVIAVHTSARPIARAVRSALAASERMRVTVVCHDVDPDAIRDALGALAEDADDSAGRVRLLPFRDGIRSPSGPFNAGLDAADAEWVAIMGSDDELEPGAVDAWLATAAATGADIVLPPIVRRGTADVVVPTPPTRPGRRSELDGLRDRLAYRSAPLGLLRRSAVGDLRFGGGIATGEDVLFSARLWFGEHRMALHEGLAYLVHDDAGDRVTLAPTSVHEALGFVEEVLESRWFRSQPATVRRALAIKTLRINILGQFVTRDRPEQWQAEERAALARIVHDLATAGPGSLDRLSVADRRLLDALPPESGVDAHRLLALAAARRRFGMPATAVTRSPALLFDREAPLRMMASSLAVRRALGRARGRDARYRRPAA